MARWTGRPVARSQTSTVSRWLVMPIATGSAPAAAIAARGGRANAGEDLEAVVLHPAGLRKILRDFPVAAAGDAAVLPDHQAGDAGRAFVDRENVAHSLAESCDSS